MCESGGVDTAPFVHPQPPLSSSERETLSDWRLT